MPVLNKHDIVKLVTGGPDMVVENLTEDGALCTWFDGAKDKKRTFHPDLLIKTVSPKLSNLELARRIAFILARAERNPSEAAQI
jgi:uncharacterized protein YodC (DUF2158 family)